MRMLPRWCRSQACLTNPNPQSNPAHPSAHPLPYSVLTTTMGCAALATGVAHYGDIAAALQHPETLPGMLTAGQFPWQQVGAGIWGAGRWAMWRWPTTTQRLPGAGWWARPRPACFPSVVGRQGGRRAARLHVMRARPLAHRPLLGPRPAPLQVLYCGLLTTDLALLMEILALQDVSSVEAAIIYTLEPVLGASFAWALLGERIGAKGLAGAAIIVASSLATQIMGGGSDKGGSAGSLGSGDDSEGEEAAPQRPKLAGKQD